MTREKAIEVLEYARNYDGMDYGAPSIALDMAISALRQQEHFREVTKKVEPLTNAQKIRAMSDEELAKLLCCTGWRMFEYKECLEWLQQPAEEDDKHETD